MSMTIASMSWPEAAVAISVVMAIPVMFVAVALIRRRSEK